MSVISGLFYTRYLHCFSLYRTVTHSKKLAVGVPKPPAVILAAALTQLGRLHQRKVAVKPGKVVSLACLLCCISTESSTKEKK